MTFSTHTLGLKCQICYAELEPDSCCTGHGWTYQKPSEWAARTWPDHQCFIDAMKTMCHIHGVFEPDMPGDYRACRECGHVFRRVADLLRAEATWGPGHQTDPEKIWSCPLCAHDF